MPERKLTLAAALGALSGGIAGFYAGKMAAKWELESLGDGIHIRPRDLIPMPFNGGGEEGVPLSDEEEELIEDAFGDLDPHPDDMPPVDEMVDGDVDVGGLVDELFGDEDMDMGELASVAEDVVSDVMDQAEELDGEPEDDFEPNTDDYIGPNNPAHGTEKWEEMHGDEDGDEHDEHGP